MKIVDSHSVDTWRCKGNIERIYWIFKHISLNIFQHKYSDLNQQPNWNFQQKYTFTYINYLFKHQVSQHDIISWNKKHWTTSLVIINEWNSCWRKVCLNKDLHKNFQFQILELGEILQNSVFIIQTRGKTVTIVEILLGILFAYYDFANIMLCIKCD